MALITYAQAKAHLRITDDEGKADLLLKMEQATQIVLERIEREVNDSPAWDETPTRRPTRSSLARRR